MHSGRQAEGREWSGGDGSGVEGRGGKGRAGQGRVPDCLGGLSLVGISSRSTRPWNGQPPSYIYMCVMMTSTSLDNDMCHTLGKYLDDDVLILFWRSKPISVSKPLYNL